MYQCSSWKVTIRYESLSNREKIFKVAIRAISFLKNVSLNLFLNQSEPQVKSKHIEALASHEVYCIKSYVDNNFCQAILATHQH